MATRTLRAIDLYSGVGGWALGMKLAGISIVQSFDRWDVANTTNRTNNRHVVSQADVRALDSTDLPKSIDIVIGSPPCTEFSFSNRGGNGDLSDGLKDIIKFLEVVEWLKPRWWAMENVPRAAKIIEKELGPRGKLARFRHLGIATTVVNLEEFGLPQRRRRCIAGNIDFALLQQYATSIPRHTLGDVVDALRSSSVVDPIWGIKLDRSELVDHELESPLNSEEERINAANKTLHPVYNSMPFPDRLDRSSRTVTATCTRVSRESIIIKRQNGAGYRRLTVRERATLQGFPINFQFFGETYSQKQKMAGNALPPLFSFYVAQAIQGIKPEQLVKPSEAAARFSAPDTRPTVTKPDAPGWQYPQHRTFRFAIPTLRLKSGVRFELVNEFEEEIAQWRVRFHFGSSKSIHTLSLEPSLSDHLQSKLSKKVRDAIGPKLTELRTYLLAADISRMQDVWSHRGPGGTRPFSVLDELTRTGGNVCEMLENEKSEHREILIADALARELGNAAKSVVGTAKLIRNDKLVLAGLLVGAVANGSLAQRKAPSRPTARIAAAGRR